MKKSMKIITVVAILAILLGTTMTFAAAPATTSGAPDPSKYIGNGNINTDRIDSFGQNIVRLISTIGSIVSVIVLIVLGIKYMMGSAEEKAEYKKTMLPYIIGAALVFAASSIASIVFSFAKGI